MVVSNVPHSVFSIMTSLSRCSRSVLVFFVVLLLGTSPTEVNGSDISHDRQLSVTSHSSVWPGRVVCLNWTDTLGSSVKSKLHRAFAEYREKTDLTFVNVDRCHDYYGKTTEVCKNCELAVQVTTTASKSECFGVPWVLSQPEMYLGEKCATYPNVLRSIGRVLGLEYEHKHPKRTVVVVRANLKEGARNYEKIRDGDGRVGSAPYDPLSIMHFPHNQDTLCVPKDKSLHYCDISQTSQSNCVIPKPEHCDFKLRHTFGTSKELMPNDVRTLNTLYEGVAAHSKSTNLTDRVPFLGKAQVQPPVQPPATRPPRSHWMDDVAEEDADGSDSSGDLDCEDAVGTLQGPGTSLIFTTLEEIEGV